MAQARKFRVSSGADDSARGRAAQIHHSVASQRRFTSRPGEFLSSSSDASKRGNLVKLVSDLSQFVRRLRVQSQFGDLSRAPLDLIRMELRDEHVECEWMARPGDSWDLNLPSGIAERNASMQALRDAIAVRQLLFRLLPGLRSAGLRVYRRTVSDRHELIISGTVTREEQAPKTVRSLAMRAKLFGFRFWMDDGVLENLDCQEYAVSS